MTFLSLSAATGLISCDKNQLVEPLTPSAKTTDRDSAVTTSQVLGRNQYQIKKIDGSDSNGNTHQIIFQYPREGGKVATVFRGSSQRFDYIYGSNTITATFSEKQNNGNFQKQSIWTYKLTGSGRCYEASYLNFNSNGQPSSYEPVLTYHYNGAGKLVTIKENGTDKLVLTYNGDGDLIKTVGEQKFETNFTYDKVGPYAGNLHSTGPDGQLWAGLVADNLSLNPWNLAYIDEFLPIFGQLRMHLPRRYQTRYIPTNTIGFDWSYGYVLNEDNQIVECNRVTNQGLTMKDTYSYDVSQPTQNQP
jgi:YD repeat-containing protein